MFTWKPIYRELAEKMLHYRDRQDELLFLSREMLEKGLRVIEFKDRNEAGENIPLLEIDPFTFFAHFNRGLTEENRIKILSYLKTKFELAAPVPSDFHGIPVANMQKAWFFAFAANRRDEDIPALWDLAYECLNHGPEEMNAEVFKRCLSIRQIAIPKLTIGLFWLNPDQYIALDSLMIAFLDDKGVKVNPSRVISLSDYRSVIKRVKNEISSNFPKVSRDAFIASNRLPANQDDIGNGLRKLIQETADYNKIKINHVVKYILTEEGLTEEGLKIAWFQARVFGNPAEHSWADLLTVVKGKDIVRPPRAGQQAVGASGFALDLPSCSQQSGKQGFGFRGRPITHAGTAKRQSTPETGLSFSI